MEILTNCNIIINIELIELVSGGNQKFEIVFITKDKEKYKLIFNSVWDMRYSIENASIDRFYQLRKSLPEGIIDNSVYKVKDSEYIKYFESQVSGTRPVNELMHYILYDMVDTTLDILTVKEPALVRI